VPVSNRDTVTLNVTIINEYSYSFIRKNTGQLAGDSSLVMIGPLLQVVGRGALVPVAEGYRSLKSNRD
jgi:hypothetical protein